MKKLSTLVILLVGLNAFAKGPLFAGFAPVPKPRPAAPKVEKKSEAVGTVELPEVEIPSDNDIAETCSAYYRSCRDKGRSHKQCAAVSDFCTPASLRM